MKTVGQLLHQKRHQLGLSIDDLSRLTRIQPQYLKAIESDDFSKLPTVTFTKGFIQSYAKAVGVDPNMILAIFRRDFDQNRRGQIIPRGIYTPIKPTPSAFWNPRTTTIAIGICLGLLVLTYTVFQLRLLNLAPQITLVTPEQNQIVSPSVEVKGSTATDALIFVNNQPVALKPDGSFQTTLNLPPGENTILIRSESRDGKTTTVFRNVKVAN